MKHIFLALFMVLTLSYANADTVRDLTPVVTVDSLGSTYTTITVPSTTTVYTKSISLKNQSALSPVGVAYKATSSGTISVSIQAEQSHKTPATEGAADVTYQNFEPAVTTSDASWRMNTLDTVIMPYMRFKIVGTGSNDASTTIQIKVSKQ